MDLTAAQRSTMLEKIEVAVGENFFDPAFDSAQWHQLVERHRGAILNADGTRGFEAAVSSLLTEFSPKTALGLLSSSTPITPRNAINASFATERVDDDPRWVFQDVLPTGISAKAGVQPGDVLLEIDGKVVIPGEKPSGGPPFTMGNSFSITVGRGVPMVQKLVQIEIPSPKYKDNPYASLTPVTTREISPEVAYLRVSLFQGKVGIDFANELDKLLADTLSRAKALIVDLRGNPGGGIGGLALMSYMTPARLPVGYSRNRKMAVEGRDPSTLPVFDKVPRSRLAIPRLAVKFLGKTSVFLRTEGLADAAYKGRIVILVNAHTTGAAEMVAQFAQENGLATILGDRTPGRLVSRSASKLGFGYRLIVPVAAYVSAKGNQIEGNGIVPDVSVTWSFENARHGRDNQLEAAINSLRSTFALV